MGASRRNVGLIGEDAAAEFFEAQGFSVVARNIHLSHLEIDLILENEEFLVFVEVKTRSCLYPGSSSFGRPATAVDKRKRLNIASAAAEYLRRNPTEKQPRIDVIEVYLSRGDCPSVLKIEHIRNAFGARG